MSETKSLKEKYIKLKQKLFDIRYSYLNEKQREAVYTNEGPLLILAGAGSGKTTVLVNRIAFLIKYGGAYFNDIIYISDISDNIVNNGSETEINESEIETLEAILKYAENLKDSQTSGPNELDDILGQFAYNPCPAYAILSITFTNKAANEMKTRLKNILGEAADNIWAGTFHSVCVRMLRRYINRLGYNSNFTIYDTDDVKRQITAIMKDFNISEDNLPVRYVSTVISRAKDELKYPDEFVIDSNNLKEKEIKKIYEEYQKRLKLSNALDFDDIIALTVEILRTDFEAREYYNNKFRYILVDEYQDTNFAQYALIALLSQKHSNVMVVGDDDQSIYKFRGATIANILSFTKKFENAKLIKLEQNYRSTKTILEAANGIIKNNEGRMGKALWTEKENGTKITIKENNNQNEESDFIIDGIIDLIDGKDKKYKDFAVLYRVNAQSANIETAFAKSAIPYRVLGGIRFYERKEIKDMMAYFCVVNNTSDSVRLKRIINVPKRQIGDATISAIEQVAIEENRSMFEIIENAEKYPALSRNVNKLKAFAGLINNFIELEKKESLPDFFEKVFDLSGYRTMLEDAGKEEIDRLDNIKELISQAITYTESKREELRESGELEEIEANGYGQRIANLTGFLEEVALISDIDNYDETADAVTLMTIHSAKGLEFPVVFLPGMEENLFPSRQSAEKPEELEEERRLAYVAVTRAKEKVYMTYAKERLLYGRTGFNKISRFVEEIPEFTAEHIKIPESERRYSSPNFGSQKKYPPRISPHSEFSTDYITASARINKERENEDFEYTQEFKTGDMVEHPSFGEGLIINATDLGGDTLYEVAFDDVGTKKIMGTYAKFKLKN
ncbi:MAG: UvrD-helicase domain-containing protein [Oscillospiraceae bacterium]|nr:UvrD-helicase domain-containing protein [Oscillospiraceae bacterium]